MWMCECGLWVWPVSVVCECGLWVWSASLWVCECGLWVPVARFGVILTILTDLLLNLGCVWIIFLCFLYFGPTFACLFDCIVSAFFTFSRLFGLCLFASVCLTILSCTPLFLWLYLGCFLSVFIPNVPVYWCERRGSELIRLWPWPLYPGVWSPCREQEGTWREYYTVLWVISRDRARADADLGPRGVCRQTWLPYY